MAVVGASGWSGVFFSSFFFSIKFYALAKDIQIANANTECIP